MNHDDNKRLLQGYNRLLEHTRHIWHEISEEARPTLNWLVSRAIEKFDLAEELSREEAEKIANYLKRDIEDVANYLTGPEAKELKDWLKFDINLIEEEVLELFASVADPTKLELLALEERARQASQYHSGEITGIGTLHCSDCGKAMHFHQSGHISPCPACTCTTFQRDEKM